MAGPQDKEKTNRTRFFDLLIFRTVTSISFVFSFSNLLTDNGSQFNRKNQTIRKYCETNIIEKHISTSVYHPQIMGKLSAFQKGLKRFLYYALGTSGDELDIDHYIDVYVHWYKNRKYHSVIAR